MPCSSIDPKEEPIKLHVIFRYYTQQSQKPDCSYQEMIYSSEKRRKQGI